jgi:protocatechuate 3,4-dioxygenase, beta subunit
MALKYRYQGAIKPYVVPRRSMEMVVLTKRVALVALLVVLSLGTLPLSGCSSRGQGQGDQRMPDTVVSAIVGGGCEGCDLMFVGMPSVITPTHTSVGWHRGNQRLTITGRVMQRDGRTPARDVLVYYWHTDDRGLYTPDPTTPAGARDHGALRGWIRTDSSGSFTVHTSRPAAYPGQDIPQHVHLSIKEPGLKDPYYADLYFDDDPLYLPHRKRNGRMDRAGTELLRVVVDSSGGQIAEHDIVLGLNIPWYPNEIQSGRTSGLEIGEDQPSFRPYHIYGPDSGTRACPVCTYGRHHGVLLFVGEDASWEQLPAWVRFLEEERASRGSYLKAYVVAAINEADHRSHRIRLLQDLGAELRIQRTALTYVPSFTDENSEIHLSKIDPSVGNTLIIYKHRTIVEKIVGAVPTDDMFRRIRRVLDDTKGHHFDLPEPYHR